VKTLFIELESPWENGYVESFNGKFRDECLNREIFYTLTCRTSLCMFVDAFFHGSVFAWSGVKKD
jgi:spore maturation protein CgeB